jgi:hypothetical protein
MNDPITTTIKQVLDNWQHTQLNIASETGRDMLAKELSKALLPVIADCVESIVAPDANTPLSF